MSSLISESKDIPASPGKTLLMGNGHPQVLLGTKHGSMSI